jgi:hypothetical protein
VPVLVALALVERPPGADRGHRVAPVERGDGVIVGQRHPVGVEPRRDAAQQLVVAELEDVAHAGHGVRVGLQEVRHAAEDAVDRQVVGVERIDERRARGLEGRRAGLADAAILAVADHPHALALELVQRRARVNVR